MKIKNFKNFFGKKHEIKYNSGDVVRAIKNGDINELEKVSNKENINCIVDFGITPLNYSIYKNNYDITIKLIELGADINLADVHENTTPLISAAIYGNYKLIKKLLMLGADPYVTNIYNKMFIDYLNSDKIDIFKKDFPEIYDYYLLKQNIKKYNL